MKTPRTPGRNTGKNRPLVPALRLKVFIGYADLRAVRRATSTIADAIRCSGQRVTIEPMLWRFDQLASNHWRDRAIEAALSADVIVLASSESGSGLAVEPWVDAFLAANRGHRATIVAVSGENEAWTISIEERVPHHGALAAPIPFQTADKIEAPRVLMARVS